MRTTSEDSHIWEVIRQWPHLVPEPRHRQHAKHLLNNPGDKQRPPVARSSPRGKNATLSAAKIERNILSYPRGAFKALMFQRKNNSRPSCSRGRGACGLGWHSLGKLDAPGRAHARRAWPPPWRCPRLPAQAGNKWFPLFICYAKER